MTMTSLKDTKRGKIKVGQLFDMIIQVLQHVRRNVREVAYSRWLDACSHLPDSATTGKRAKHMPQPSTAILFRLRMYSTNSSIR